MNHPSRWEIQESQIPKSQIINTRVENHKYTKIYHPYLLPLLLLLMFMHDSCQSMKEKTLQSAKFIKGIGPKRHSIKLYLVLIQTEPGAVLTIFKANILIACVYWTQDCILGDSWPNGLGKIYAPCFEPGPKLDFSNDTEKFCEFNLTIWQAGLLAAANRNWNAWNQNHHNVTARRAGRESGQIYRSHHGISHSKSHQSSNSKFCFSACQPCTTLTPITRRTTQWWVGPQGYQTFTKETKMPSMGKSTPALLPSPLPM